MNVSTNPSQEEDDISQWTVRTIARDRCSPELEELYVRLNKTLNDCNQTAHLDELDVLLAEMGSQNIDPTEIVTSLDEIMRMAVDRSLNQVGVELIPDISLEMLSEVADTLLLFDPTDLPGLVIDILDSAEDADDAFCKVMDQFGTYEYDEWTPQILQISEHFTSNVRKVCADAVTSDDVGMEDSSADLLKRLSRLVKANGESLGADLGSKNLGLGMSLENLYGLHVGRLLDLPEEQQVDQLYSLAAISSESFESANTAVAECLDDLCYDMDSRRKAEQIRMKVSEVYKPIFGVDNA